MADEKAQKDVFLSTMIKWICLSLLISQPVFSQQKPAVLQKYQQKLSQLSYQRAVIQEQKLRLEIDLIQKENSLIDLRKIIATDRKGIYEALGFLKYVKNHSQQMIFQGIGSSSNLDRRQRMVEDLSLHQIQKVREKIKAFQEIQTIQKSVESQIAAVELQEAKLAELERDIQNIYKRELSGKAFPLHKGKMNWPLSPIWNVSFGINTDKATKIVYRTNGVYLRGNVGQDILPIFEGIVAFTGLVEGFGPTVIVDHGEHFYSVYSGLKDISVEAGQHVKETERIALSDNVEGFNFSGIYFELRHFGQPIDPGPWMK